MADDLNAEKTPGFKVGEKKTVDEYQKLGKRFRGRGVAVVRQAKAKKSIDLLHVWPHGLIYVELHLLRLDLSLSIIRSPLLPFTPC